MCYRFAVEVILMFYKCYVIGWWNGELSISFLRYHFGSRPSQEEPILLLWDDFSGHWTEGVQCYAKAINVVLLKVPAHATPVSQPADVAWNFPLKSRLRQHWHCDMQAQIAAPREPGVLFKLVRPKRGLICEWICDAWEDIPSITISNGFRASGILPSENCIAASGLVADMERLSLFHGSVVDEAQDFDADSRVEQ
jgi:hypothetical protein